MSPKVTGQHGKSQRLVGEKFLSQKKHVTLERVSATKGREGGNLKTC